MRRRWLLLWVLTACGPSVATVDPVESGGEEQAASRDPDAILQERARALLDRAREVEPTVTPLLSQLASAAGGEMVGLEHRFKTLESTLRKMRLELSEDPGLTPETVTIHDALRYTMRVDDDPAGNYVRTVAATLAALEREGHDVMVVKNYWPRGDNYSGVNTVLEAPSGLPWELQFHTSESYRVQHETRDAYEELRLSATPIDRKRALFDEMTEAWDAVPVPADVLEPQNLHPEEEIRDRPRP